MNHPNSISVSLMILTWDGSESLEPCLQSVACQTRLPEEVVIVNHGIGDGDKTMMQRFHTDFPIPIIHVDDIDSMPGLAATCNKALKAVRSDYIIHIDQYCILEKHFVSDHLKLAEPGYFVTGSCGMIGETLSKRILNGKPVNLHLFKPGIKNYFTNLRIPFLSGIFSHRVSDPHKIQKFLCVCNMAFWRKDLFEVNGYNQEVNGMGPGNTELAIRLLHHGIHIKQVRLSAVQMHLSHPENVPNNMDQSDNNLWESFISGVSVCENGIDTRSLKLSDTEEIDLTGIIYTCNDEAHIKEAIKSIDFVNEIFVVDFNSRDRTAETARSLGAIVIQKNSSSVSTGINDMVPQPQHRWLLLMNANERIPMPLRREIILTLKEDPEEVGFLMPRIHYFLEKRIRYSGVRNDRVSRLIRKDHFTLDIEPDLRGIRLYGLVGYLNSNMIHSVMGTSEEYFNKLSHEVDLEIHNSRKVEGTIHAYHMVVKPFFRFIYYLFLRGALLDGVAGLTISFFEAHRLRLRYMKLWMKQKSLPVHDDIH